MAMKIVEECINCGACEPECPNQAITAGDDIYIVDPEKCTGCTVCARNCPVDAIYGGKKEPHTVDQEKCVKCGTCLTACPPQYNAIVKLSPPSEVPEDKTKKNL